MYYVFIKYGYFPFFYHLLKNGSKGEKGEIGPPGQAVSMVLKTYLKQFIFMFKCFAAS